MKLFHVAIALLTISFTQAQVATISNDRPLRGDIIEIIYTPDSTSIFQLTDEIYVSYQEYSEDFSINYETKKMKRIGEKFTFYLEIGGNASVYEIYFKNADKEDYRSTLEVKPINDEGDYYRNSYRNVADSDLDACKKEMALFPDNYTLFVPRWIELDYNNKDSAKAIIQSELQKISALRQSDSEKIQNPKTTNGSIEFAMSLGHAVLGDFDTSWLYFVELMEYYTESALQYNAQSLYHYLLYSHSSSDSLFQNLIYKYIKLNPTSPTARDWMRLVDKSNNSDRATIKEIGKYWMKEEPRNAKTKIYYAKACIDKKEKIFYLNEAVNALLNKENSVKMYYSWDSRISWELIEIIEEYNSAGAYAQALSFIEMFEKNSNKENAKLYRLKGISNQSLSNYPEAFKWYSLSADMGDEVALDSAKSVFDKMNLYNVDFEEYSNEVLSELFYEEEVSEAPKYDVEDVYGNRYKSEDLQGKVVVLNFWFIGCAPCIREMPDLNEMVKDYEGKDVVFIAFANDREESLEKFLKKRDFKYNVIPSSYSVAQSYNVSSFPTHVIIDKKGNIRSTITGTAKEKDLASYIDRVLRF